MTERAAGQRRGEWIAITGANRGVGLATARELARRGFRIILLCRSEARGGAAMESLTGAEDSHQFVPCDLANPGSARRAARSILKSGVSLRALVNNAAVIASKRRETERGWEFQIAVAHLGHAVLSRRLLPVLKRKGGPARLLVVSSEAHRGRAFDFSDPFFQRKRYGPRTAYQQAKLANVLYAKALARRVDPRAVEVAALHPGVYGTELFASWLGALRGVAPVAGAIAGSADAAGPVLADLAAGREDEMLNGAYLDARNRKRPSRHARDHAAQERLWAWTAEVLGEDPAPPQDAGANPRGV